MTIIIYIYIYRSEESEEELLDDDDDKEEDSYMEDSGIY